MLAAVSLLDVLHFVQPSSTTKLLIVALTATIQDDLKQALRARDEVVLRTLRMLSAALTNQRIALGHELSDDEALVVLRKQIQQRAESAASYREANSEDRARAEEEESTVLERYLPAQADLATIRKFITERLAERTKPLTGADQGAVIRETMQHFGAASDGKTISDTVRTLISES
jgi:uncharacterized protein YqeY